MNDFVIIDTETTGLVLPNIVGIEKQPRIIELGAVRVDPYGKIIAEFSELINPGVQIEEKITEITGITNEDLEDRPPFTDFLESIKELFEGCTALIAHNAPFDSSLLRFDLERAGCADFPWPPEIVCTVQAFYHIKGRRLRLPQLYQHFVGEELQQTHRALDDVMALHEILMASRFFKEPRSVADDTV